MKAIAANGIENITATAAAIQRALKAAAQPGRSAVLYREFGSLLATRSWLLGKALDAFAASAEADPAQASEAWRLSAWVLMHRFPKYRRSDEAAHYQRRCLEATPVAERSEHLLAELFRALFFRGRTAAAEAAWDALRHGALSTTARDLWWAADVKFGLMGGASPGERAAAAATLRARLALAEAEPDLEWGLFNLVYQWSHQASFAGGLGRVLDNKHALHRALRAAGGAAADAEPPSYDVQNATEAGMLAAAAASNPAARWVARTEFGHNGAGTSFIDDPTRLPAAGQPLLVSRFIADPLRDQLGRKMEIRVYVLAATKGRFFIFRDWFLVKVAATADSHFTNMEGSGATAAVQAVAVAAAGGGAAWANTWARVEALVATTLKAGQEYAASTFFDDSDHDGRSGDGTDGASTGALLGIDIIVDEALRPWLIEVNEACAFGEYKDLQVAAGAAAFARALASTLIAIAEGKSVGGGWMPLIVGE